ncbi:peptide deformylase [Photorhabdus tasmaniensis]|uniref:peptide deformylase n=1 Tax=Photorhabdus tasmaniensis TaxID=1004159 RepID=UPI0040412411
MATLKILTIPDERLRQKCVEVANVEEIQGLIDDMLDTMYSTDNGIGLAAPQVGRKEAVVIIDISTHRNQPLILVNPKIVEKERSVMGQEGCLSVPGYYADVERFEKVKVEALNRHGETITVESEDFLAIVMQHEIDHLHGKIFIDYLSPLKRQMALKKIKKYHNNRAS